MDLNEVAVFIKVVQLGTFSGAAKALGMPNSTVSFKVSSLEKRLGVTPIQRTTSKIHVNPLGKDYFKNVFKGSKPFDRPIWNSSNYTASRKGNFGSLHPPNWGPTCCQNLFGDT